MRVVKSQRRAVVRRYGSVRGGVRGAARRHGCAAEVHGWHALRELCVGSGRRLVEVPEKAPGKTRQFCTSLSLRGRQTRCRAEFARRFSKSARCGGAKDRKYTVNASRDPLTHHACRLS